MVEHRTPNREVLGSIAQAAPYSALEQDTLTPQSIGELCLCPDMTESC